MDIHFSTSSLLLFDLLITCGTQHLSDVFGVARCFVDLIVEEDTERERKKKKEEEEEISASGSVIHQRHNTYSTMMSVGEGSHSGETLKIVAKKSQSEKCVRCWRFICDMPGSLCERCASVLQMSKEKN
jgi:hypothetical protein